VDIDPGVIGTCGFCDGVFATDVDVLEDVETIGLNCFALGAENNETNISKRKNVQKKEYLRG